jgi:hypothetical protein
LEVSFAERDEEARIDRESHREYAEGLPEGVDPERVEEHRLSELRERAEEDAPPPLATRDVVDVPWMSCRSNQVQLWCRIDSSNQVIVGVRYFNLFSEGVWYRVIHRPTGNLLTQGTLAAGTPDTSQNQVPPSQQYHEDDILLQNLR